MKNKKMKKMYKEVSYIKKDRGGASTKISLIYDTFCQRIIEKWISFPLVNDDSKYVITDRLIYIYGREGFVKSKIEIETGGLDTHNYGSVQTPYETFSSFERTYDRKGYGVKFKTKIKYLLNNRNNKHELVYKTLNIQVSEDIKNNCYKLKLLSVKTRLGDLYKYFYSKADPFQLISIKRYRNSVSAFFRQKVEEKKDNLLNSFKKFDKGNQNYFSEVNYDFNNENYWDVFVHNSILDEDMFSTEINELLELYKKHCN